MKNFIPSGRIITEVYSPEDLDSLFRFPALDLSQAKVTFTLYLEFYLKNTGGSVEITTENVFCISIQSFKPYLSTPYSIGYDLYSIYPSTAFRKEKFLNSSFSLIPNGIWLASNHLADIQVRPRSSSTRYGFVHFGTIDPDYRNEVGTLIYFNSPPDSKSFFFPRFSQLIYGMDTNHLVFIPFRVLSTFMGIDLIFSFSGDDYSEYIEKYRDFSEKVSKMWVDFTSSIGLESVSRKGGFGSTGQ